MAGVAVITQVPVLLEWKVPVVSDRGFPRGARFTVPARFSHQGSDWTKNAWSLVVECKAPVSQTGAQEAMVEFLMPSAPHEWLARGQRFDLFEGKLLLASGIVK